LTIAPHLNIGAKALGQKRRLAPDWVVPVPPDFLSKAGGEAPTLRQIISHIVIEEVNAFRKRQRDRTFVRILTEKEMSDQGAKGKISFGGDNLRQEINDEEAVEAALQAFEDGIYLVILDGEEQKNLDQQVYLSEESHLLFVRLVMLAGG
jgi:hypothetical protein